MNRLFSTTSRLKLYSLARHKQTVGLGTRLETLNKIEEGMDDFNTDVTKPYGLMKREALKPIQHPKNLHSDNSSIVTYQVPPKNLTPYNQIPD